MLGYLLLDIGLFLITLLVILMFRFQDRKDRQIYLVKTYMDRMRTQMEERSKEIHGSFDQITESIELHESSVRSMIARVDRSLEELDTHASELNELQSYMTHYHRILKDLAALTEKAEKRLASLQESYDDMDQLREELISVREQHERVERSVGELHTSIENVRQEKIAQIDQGYVQELTAQLTQAAEAGESRINRVKQAFEQEYDQIISSLDTKIARAISEAQDTLEQSLARAETEFAVRSAAYVSGIEQQLTDSRSAVGGAADPYIDPSFKKIPFPEPGLGTKLKDMDSEIASLAQQLGGIVVDIPGEEDASVQSSAEQPRAAAEESDAAITEEESSYIFGILDDDMVTEAIEEIEELMEKASGRPVSEAQDDEDQDDDADGVPLESIFDGEAFDHLDDDEIDEEEDDKPEEEEDSEEDGIVDDDVLDEIYYEDDEEILFDEEDDDQEGEEAEDQAPQPVIPPGRRTIVEEHLKEGFTVQEIAELTDIPKGEIELIKELSDFSS